MLEKKLKKNIIKDNTQLLLQDFKSVFQKYKQQVIFVNNKDWLNNMSLSDYLSLAYYFSVNNKLKFSTFKNRIEQSLNLSMTEFIYQDLQLIDFLHLYREYNCTVQVGGGDQWGNISFGVKNVNKITAKDHFYGICTPLITDNQQDKIGKKPGGRIC